MAVKERPLRCLKAPRPGAPRSPAAAAEVRPSRGPRTRWVARGWVAKGVVSGRCGPVEGRREPRGRLPEGTVVHLGRSGTPDAPRRVPRRLDLAPRPGTRGDLTSGRVGTDTETEVRRAPCEAATAARAAQITRICKVLTRCLDNLTILGDLGRALRGCGSQAARRLSPRGLREPWRAQRTPRAPGRGRGSRGDQRVGDGTTSVGRGCGMACGICGSGPRPPRVGGSGRGGAGATGAAGEQGARGAPSRRLEARRHRSRRRGKYAASAGRAAALHGRGATGLAKKARPAEGPGIQGAD